MRPHWFNPLLRILLGCTAPPPPFPPIFFQSFKYCRRSSNSTSKASIINPAKEIFDYVNANMIKLEKCNLNILSFYKNFYKITPCLFVCGTHLTECNSVPMKPCKYKLRMLELLCNSLEMLKKAVDFTW